MVFDVCCKAALFCSERGGESMEVYFPFGLQLETWMVD